MAKYTEARKEGNKRWDAKNLDRISVAMPKGRKEEIKKYAERNGESVNAFINRAIMEVTETESIHKAYQRALLRYLEKIKAAIKANDNANAEALIQDLIEDTKADITE